MDRFKINKSSWHYKLNRAMYMGGKAWFDRYGIHEINNFCAYWRSTMFNVFSVFVMILVTLGFAVILFGSLFVFATMTWYQIFLFVVAVFLVFAATCLFALCMWGLGAGIKWAASKIPSKQADNLSVPAPKPEPKPITVKKTESLFVQKYKAWKGKYCPKVEFVE